MPENGGHFLLSLPLPFPSDHESSTRLRLASIAQRSSTLGRMSKENYWRTSFGANCEMRDLLTNPGIALKILAGDLFRVASKI
jgi:hypothetical protein